MMEIDDKGLDAIDIKVLKSMAEKFNGGPCGLDTLAATINEDANTIQGINPPVWSSANAPGGDEINAGYLKKYFNRVKCL